MNSLLSKLTDHRSGQFQEGAWPDRLWRPYAAGCLRCKPRQNFLSAAGEL